MFFKFTQMQSISILSSFVHPCPFLAFLCFVEFFYSLEPLFSYFSQFYDHLISAEIA